jgi:hypothetical protein
MKHNNNNFPSEKRRSRSKILCETGRECGCRWCGERVELPVNRTLCKRLYWLVSIMFCVVYKVLAHVRARPNLINVKYVRLMYYRNSFTAGFAWLSIGQSWRKGNDFNCLLKKKQYKNKQKKPTKLLEKTRKK